ncbi:MAG: hypothetical protein HFF04_08345 [Oscillospiraceae bacterium]|nr:hypothetical protein [Oscillospiraceae bacterium]
MANLESIIAGKAARDTEWQAQQQAERDNVTSMQDFGVLSIISDPDFYLRYLAMQGDNPTYSAGNVAIALAGLPDGSTVFGTAERWQSLHRTVKEGETGVKIFARDQRTKQYVLADAYDVSQTKGQDIKQTIFEDGSKEMETALETLLNFSKAKPVTDKELDAPAYYDEDKKELAINPDYPDGEAFASIAAEVALTRFHDKGFNRNYSWARYELDAQSVAYILCRRFGIEPKTPNMERLTERFEGMTPDECRSVLDGVQDMSKQIGRSIEKSLEEKRRSRSAVRRPAR